MNVEIGTETPIFLFWEYLFRNFGIFSLQCGSWDRNSACWQWNRGSAQGQPGLHQEPDDACNVVKGCSTAGTVDVAGAGGWGWKPCGPPTDSKDPFQVGDCYSHGDLTGHNDLAPNMVHRKKKLFNFPFPSRDVQVLDRVLVLDEVFVDELERVLYLVVVFFFTESTRSSISVEGFLEELKLVLVE